MNIHTPITRVSLFAYGRGASAWLHIERLGVESWSEYKFSHARANCVMARCRKLFGACVVKGIVCGTRYTWISK